MTLRQACFPAALLLMAACGGTSGEAPAEPAPKIEAQVRTYPKPAADTWTAAVSAAKSLDLRIDDDRHDRMGGMLVARRATGDRVTVRVRSLDARSSEATVRTETDIPELARRLQDRIAEALGKPQ